VIAEAVHILVYMLLATHDSLLLVKSIRVRLFTLMHVPERLQCIMFPNSLCLG